MKQIAKILQNTPFVKIYYLILCSELSHYFS